MNDLSDQYPERVEQMSKEANAISASIDASALGKDYPEGEVLQPQRGEQWDKMPEYQALFERFAELKPGWVAPDPNRKSAAERRAEKKGKSNPGEYINQGDAR